MTQLIQKMWADLNTPSDFHADWYGGGSNQLAHVAIGAAFAALICIVCGLVLGVMPFKWLVFTGILGFYALGIEGGHQRSPVVDGMWDTYFIMCGVSIVLFSLTEVGVTPDGVHLVLHEKPALISLGVTTLSLIAYVIPRAIRQYRSN
jgi:hypothetical protein